VEQLFVEKRQDIVASASLLRLAENDFFSTVLFPNVCTFLPTYIVFLSLLWLKAVFTGLAACSPTAVIRLRTVEELIWMPFFIRSVFNVMIILRGSVLLCRSKHHLF